MNDDERNYENENPLARRTRRARYWLNQALSWSEFGALIAEAVSNAQGPAALSCEVFGYALQAIASRETLADTSPIGLVSSFPVT